MSDPLNEYARSLSRRGDHDGAKYMFQASAEIYDNPHSKANAVYEDSRSSSSDIRRSVNECDLTETGHGQWLLSKANEKEKDEYSG